MCSTCCSMPAMSRCNITYANILVLVQADVPAPPADEESQYQQITAARKYIAEQALKQQTKKVCIVTLTPPSPSPPPPALFA